jgi:uncharacterized protein YlzI (FlbEa/FlbD family)
MSRFIRLTNIFGDPIYINSDTIEVVEYYRECGEDTTCAIRMIGGGFIQVKESPSEVLRMIESEELSIPHVPYDPLHKKADIDAHIADLEARYRRDEDAEIH